MTTLNPDLLSKDMDAVLNDAAVMRKDYQQQAIMPELLLLALIRHQETAAARLLNVFKNTRGVDLEQLERQVELAIQSRRDQDGNLDFIAKGNKKVPLSRQTIIMLDDALSVANSMHEVRIDTDHALTVLSESSMSTSGLLRQVGITPKALRDIVSDSSQVLPVKRSSGTTQDFVATARRGNMRAVYFREDLLREMINILTQSVNRHIILIGPDGVGKRTLAYSLALLMSEGKGPAGLASLVQIDETALLDNEQQAVRAGMSKARNGILFVPHLHRFFGGPIKAEFSKATPLIQKAFLDDNPVIIASTTDQEYQQRLSLVSAITENSQVIRVPEPSAEETVEMLKIMKPHLEADYDIKIQEDALQLATNLAKRYLAATPLPRSAEHLLHRTAAMVSMSRQQHLAFKPEMANDGNLDVEDVTLAASQMTGVPVSKLGEDERLRYASMVEHLNERIKGQDEAVMVVSRAIKTARVGLKDPRRPIGAFLFLGPTGVGKTELARVLADFMFGSEDAMLPLDMSEFKDESSINRLIGSPTGYVGSEEGGQLTERVRQQPYIIILFDEIEKAHPRVLDILLQVIEEGRLTDGRGVTTRFSESVIIMTSNIGSEHLSVPYLNDEIKESVMDEVRDYLRPEFINRLDEVVMFNALDADTLALIMQLELKKETRMAEERGLTLSFTDGAIDYLLSLNDEPEYGARPLKRIIRRNVREPLADFLLRANPAAGTEVRISSARKKGGGLKFAATVDGEEISME
ncbi:ATP-dependent Clp protease ATP-binding subunit [Phototrophicus methaneseepsis]|uniref:ATP-dependent Clp protease ATP-binding subunit n=1 Tax=Phototrophicus methaneseepsis TaxID=2710758 RepID=A0A7S8IDR2_9CHLR|nr:ATP-dependent Clp protease ATP-binding subunit [Phototrophicus methaneseepsis]QPC81614.1 ATP-dependent Clp protease ATP-binding subunit [Phototrophicus methaneseepsis]